jgi:hypothetical protein
MRPILVVPGAAAPRAERLLADAGWVAEPAPDDVRVDPRSGPTPAGTARPVLFVPGSAIADRLRRILVIHEGRRSDRAGIDAADEAAVASGASVIVLHLPASTPSTNAGSMQVRMADHAAHDWAEWQEEFLRRFCHCSKGVEVSLRVGTGSPDAMKEQISEERADLVIASIGRQPEPRAIDAIRPALDVAPVLLMPSVGQDESARTAATR